MRFEDLARYLKEFSGLNGMFCTCQNVKGKGVGGVHEANRRLRNEPASPAPASIVPESPNSNRTIKKTEKQTIN